MLRSATRFLFILPLAALAGWVAASPGWRFVPGDCADVFGAQVCTWALLDGETVLEVGATVPLAAIENAPAEAEMTWPPRMEADIQLPQEAAPTGLRHLTIFWEPHGHPPGPYLHPHFDFHFYNLSSEETRAIDCADVTKPAVVPSGYVLPDVEVPDLGTLIGLCVPQMGMHGLSGAEIESEAAFTGTMVVGYYAGAPIFVEPMITREKLMRRESFTLEMPAVEPPDGVRYPTRVRVDYDAAEDAYRIVRAGF